LELMQPIKAVVRNGRIVVDAPANLPDGTEVELQLIAKGDPWADMDPQGRAELEEEIEAGYRDVASGNVVDARELLAQLRAKNA
jgi:hypothetical protein